MLIRPVGLDVFIWSIYFVVCVVLFLKMSDFASLKNQGEVLGLSGDDLLKYILHQQTIHREERAKEREAVRDTERARLDALKIEADKEKAKQDHDLQMAKVNSPTIAGVNPSPKVQRPTMPLYQDGEDIANYLVRFERVAELLGIDTDSYAVRLGSLLTGKAVNVYTSLSPDITKDYDSLKKALLFSYSKTPDGYRMDFRTSKIKAGETYRQHSISLTRHLEQWLQSKNVPETFSGLKDFVILDQLMSSLSADLRMFLKERNVATLEEAVVLADTWASAHNAYTKVTSGTGGKKGPVKPPVPEGAASNPRGNKSNIVCHYCAEVGHIRPNCPSNPANFKKTNHIKDAKIGFCLSDDIGDNSFADSVTSGTVNPSKPIHLSSGIF